MGTINDNPTKSKQSSSTLILVIISFIMILLFSFYYFYPNIFPTINKNKINPKSVAVLPFDNYSSANEDQYFSDGLTEVIIANLAKIKDLKVISRTSVMQYKNTNKSLKVIGRELGVAHILEGSVQRAGNMVRIVGQLIDANSDEHIWAETYDENISNIFQVQSEIAENIAKSLKSEITNEEKDLINQKITNNTKAYDYYLMANDLSHRNKTDIDLSINLLKKAILLDSNFIDAIAAISNRYSASIHFGFDVSKEAKLNAKKYYLKAISKNPNSLSALRARGIYYYWAEKKYLQALEDFNKILSIEPGNSMNYEFIGYVQRRIGMYNESLFTLERVKELNPNYGYIYRELYDMYYAMKLYDKGDELAEKLVNFFPKSSFGYHALANKEFRITENINDEELIIKTASEKIGKEKFSEFWWWTNLRKGNFEEIINITKSFPEIMLNQLKIDFKAAIFSYLYKVKGDDDLAQKYFKEEKNIIDRELFENPNDPRLHNALGRYYAKVGDIKNSIKYHESAISLYPLTKDAWGGLYYYITYAQSMGIIGDSDKAIELLVEIFKRPGYLHWWDLEFHPFFYSLKKDEKFREFIKQQKNITKK